MNRLGQAIRSGDWVSPERVRVYAAILLAFAAGMLAFLVLTAQGLVDFRGRPLGTDFSNVYAAGKWVLAGRPEAPFDPALQHEMQRRLFGPDTPFYGWHYPPMFLGVAALLAVLPYLPSLVAWQAATLALYHAAIRAIVPRRDVWLPALAFPAVVINIAHGHNGFLSAALFGGGLVLLDRRPVTAGVLFGLLCYKPQLGLLIPFALAASGRWRTFAAAAVTVAAVVALSWLAFGSAPWLEFRDSLGFTRTVVLEEGQTGFHKIQSAFAAARMWGAPVAFAYAVQGVVISAVLLLTVRLWRREAAFAPKAAALLAGALLCTPYVLDYDLMVMAPAIALLAMHGLTRGFLPYEKSALVFCWFAPLLARGVGEHIGVPLGLIALLLLFGLAVRRASADLGTAAPR